MLIIGFIVAQIVLLVVIIFVLKRLIFSDTNSALNRLTKMDNMNREKEKILTTKLAETQKFVEEQKILLNNQGEEMKQESRRAAQEMHADIIRKAKEEGDEIVKKAQLAREQIKADAMVDAESRVVELCNEILVDVFSGALQAHLNDMLVEEFIEELEKADLSKVAGDAKKVQIISGRGISEHQNQQIKNVLTGKLKNSVTIEPREDAKLIGGVMMKMGTTVVDGTLAERLRETAATMKEKLNWKYAVE